MAESLHFRTLLVRRLGRDMELNLEFRVNKSIQISSSGSINALYF
jgi:hypothetical protein